MGENLLDSIMAPEDLRRLDYRELEQLCAEIRSFLIEKVSKTGGHLSSNLGVIELTVALHRHLRSPRDMLLFDVGHQCYTHKILTGRRDGFDDLRGLNGISGFPSPAESVHDIVPAGHASASISSAIGLARAKKLKGEPGLVVAVIGDGAFTGGMTYEAINNISDLNNLVIILNDNTMSISKNVGGLAHYLTKLRTSPQYYKAKNEVKAVLENTPVIGSGMKKGIQTMKSALRKSLYHSTFFEELGLRYVGPVDGHNIPVLCGVFSNLYRMHKPLLLHVETKKGKGFTPAERNPGAFHGVSAFDAQRISDPDVSPSDSFSTVFGKELAKCAAEDGRICAITAAMKYGTGLQYFKKAHPERFFDVGMAEEHAVTFAAGLAANGLLPVVAIYSTFLQRSYDQVIHDVVLAGQNVLFAIDRAGLVPADGETHQGIYDIAFLSQHRDFTIIAPSNYAETTYWLSIILEISAKPRAIRYPRGTELEGLSAKECTGNEYDKVFEAQGAATAIVTYGAETAQALDAARLLQKEGINTDVIQMVKVNPVPEGLTECLMGYSRLLFAEEGIARGGVGEHVAMRLLQQGYRGKWLYRGIETGNVEHATYTELLALHGLDAKALAQVILDEGCL